MIRNLSLLLLLLLAITTAAVAEFHPSTPCGKLTTEKQCKRDNFCCWRDSYCFAPTPQAPLANVECVLIQDRTTCSETWSLQCEWTEASGGCRRRPLASSTTCDEVKAAAAKMESSSFPRVRYDSIITPLVNESAPASSSSSSGINSLNQYCFSKSLNAACQFPFTHNGQPHHDCIQVDKKKNLQCMATPTTNNNKNKNQKKNRPPVMTACTCTPQNRPRSVIMVTLDDMRPEMNAAYGRRAAVTPVLDSFAKRPGTVVMDRAYVQIALCSPSRDSYMTSLLPDTTRSYTIKGKSLHQHPQRGKFKTLPQLFKEAGYYTSGGGKIFHLNKDDPRSWNEYYSRNLNQNTACQGGKNNKVTRFKLLDGSTTSLACTTANYESILDVPVLNSAMSTLERIVHQQREPFFLAVGLFKPHFPYHLHTAAWSRFSTAPVEYEDLASMGAPSPLSAYSHANLTFDLSTSEAGKTWAHTQPFEDKSGSKDKMYFRQLMRRGYLAAVYQTDDMLGQLLNKVQDLGLEDNTLLVIHGDNGFALGENNAFAKQTNFEIAVRVPVVMHVPWLRAGAVAGDVVRRNGNLFEMLDLMPTMAALMQAPQPDWYEGTDQSGQIVRAALENNKLLAELSNTHQAAFSQIMRCRRGRENCDLFTDIYAMGYTVRTREYRYTVFLPSPQAETQWDYALAMSHELYDHRTTDGEEFAFDDDDEDGALFGQVEMTNIAPQQPELCFKLFGLLVQKYVK